MPAAAASAARSMVSLYQTPLVTSGGLKTGCQCMPSSLKAMQKALPEDHDPSKRANAIAYTTGDAGHISDIAIHHNVFVSNHRMILHQWNGGDGGNWEQNVYRRDFTGSAAAFDFRRIDISGASSARA